MKIKIYNIIIIIGALTLTSCQTLNNYGFLKNENEVINTAQSHQRFLTVSINNLPYTASFRYLYKSFLLLNRDSNWSI